MMADNFSLSELCFLAALAVAGAVVIGELLSRYTTHRIKVDVPVVGVGVRYTYWLAALRNVQHARESIVEGYRKANFAFQIPTMTRMEVFICDRKMTREYQNVDENHLSFRAVFCQEFQFDFLLPGNSIRPDMIPSSVIAKGLSWQKTRAAKLDDSFFKAFSAELFYSFRAEMQMLAENQHKSLTESANASDPVSDTSAHSKWLAAPCFPFCLKIIARLTIFSLFGESLCRDVAFLDLCCDFGNALPIDALLLRSLPSWAKPLVLRYLTTTRRLGELQEIIRAEIDKRRNSGEKAPMKVRDILDYTMDWIDNRRDTMFGDAHVVHVMIRVIFAALHTSSQVCFFLVAHTLFELATRPDYIGALREEVEQCFEQHGQGTKAALDSMYKIDSFIKETQRFNPLDAASLARVALKEFTFSNGLHIPKGSVIFTPNSPIFEDERFYPKAKTFDGFRFSRMRGDPKLKSSCDLTATNEQSMHFGTGRHACPGRFMVSDEVKLAVIFILQNFDIAMENFGPRPKNHAFGKFMLPDMAAKIWLRESTTGKE
nr:P450 monooxygenase [Claviceps purpurea]